MISVPDSMSDYIELLPGRKLRRGKYGKHVTSMPSRKNGVYVMCETLLEAEFCLELERSSAVLRYLAQPFTLRFKNSRKCYTPDFSAKLQNGIITIYEVKTDAALRDTPTLDRLLLLQETFASLGHYLEIIRESQFRNPIKMGNLQLLYQKSYKEDGKESKSIINRVRKTTNNSLTVKDLIEAGFSSPSIAYAVFYGEVICDLACPFTENSRLGLRNEHHPDI
ncbi:hypothetical protein I5I61_26755 [Pseudomonas nitroreducens]|uniref:TnsA endonuclease N-terminal domain-containing protein n=1 Tax=Pseudomonas nitroreducens TaxID=46680 RepID=A0ABS0KSK0_PSENT|nr:hypothetical protein [Pseudomonas nitroreducens]MBG6291072.1 hypothetical protein [Pseudomonas nitroreducens]